MFGFTEKDVARTYRHSTCLFDQKQSCEIFLVLYDFVKKQLKILSQFSICNDCDSSIDIFEALPEF